MDKLIVLVALLGALFGCNGGRDEVVHRVVVSGKDVLLSRASLQRDQARLDCLRSASGACHYTLLPRGCASPRACPGKDARYDVAEGASRRIGRVHDARLCVVAREGDPPQCASTAGAGG
jgi:hypothetical protein